MIIVTGMPRTGTSLIMQTLDRLGITVAGKPFPPGRNRSHNPKGFWEGDTLFGDLDGFEGNIAVKVMLRPFIERVDLDPANDRIIICRRPAAALATAQANTDSGASTEARTLTLNARWYDRIETELGIGGKFENVPRLNVSLPNFRANRTTVIGDIATFTSARMTDHTEAVNNVDQ